MEKYKINMWIDKISPKEIILTDGEYSIILKHNGSETGKINNLPEIFKTTTIVDKFEIDFKKII